uniref:Uncharacterized protein n=1 Tax=Anguilla anguilla TaxID=7936 RepID=A0A0E9QZ14_ANGAN
MHTKELPFILLYVSILSVKFSFADELTQFTIQYISMAVTFQGIIF